MTAIIKELMQSRRSVREYRQQVPEESLVRELIEMACTAPSASNKQPWRFYIIRNRQVIDALANEVKQAVADIGKSISDDYLEQFNQYGNYFTRFQAAPLVIVPVYRPIAVLSNLVDEKLEPRYRKNIDKLEQGSGVVSTSLAIQNLLLYAHHKNLGASCMTGPLVANEAVRQKLSIPEGWEIACFIPIGYTDEKPEIKPRKPVDNVIRWID